MAFRLALTVGKIVTSRAPFTPSGLGPRIKKATAAEITTDTIYNVDPEIIFAYHASCFSNTSISFLSCFISSDFIPL